MKRLIPVLLSISFMSSAYAGGGNVTVNRGAGTYTVGAERGSIDCVNHTIPMRKTAKLTMRDGSDHNAPIPQPERPKWNRD